jgi:predicted phage gp36 major capsid-like protein
MYILKKHIYELCIHIYELCNVYTKFVHVRIKKPCAKNKQKNCGKKTEKTKRKERAGEEGKEKKKETARRAAARAPSPHDTCRVKRGKARATDHPLAFLDSISLRV